MDCQKVGELIYRLRKERQLTQKELADLIENEVIQNDNTLGFENFTSYLENILLKEITKDSYKESEIKHMINIYNYVKKQEFNY